MYNTELRKVLVAGLVFAILLIMTVHCSAAKADVEKKLDESRISLKLGEQRLSKALPWLKQAFGVPIWTQGVVDDPVIKVEFDGVTPRQVLDDISYYAGLKVEVTDNGVLLKPKDDQELAAKPHTAVLNVKTEKRRDARKPQTRKAKTKRDLSQGSALEVKISEPKGNILEASLKNTGDSDIQGAIQYQARFIIELNGKYYAMDDFGGITSYMPPGRTYDIKIDLGKFRQIDKLAAFPVVKPDAAAPAFQKGKNRLKVYYKLVKDLVPSNEIEIEKQETEN